MAINQNTGADTDSDFWVDLLPGQSPIRVWDKLVLGGVTFPGLCQIEPSVSCDVEVVKWQTAPPQGSTPAQFKIGIQDKGYAPAKIRATLMVWEQDQWQDLQDTLPKFSPRSGAKSLSSLNQTTALKSQLAGRDAFDISHPVTDLLAIDSVIILGISVPPIAEQTLIVLIDMMQYFPKAGIRPLHSPSGSLSGLGNVPGPDAAANLK